MFDHTQYIPCLRWKTGEYQAIWNLPATTKKTITPLIEVPEFSFDFAEKEKPKTIDKHIERFVKRVRDKWGEMACFIDMKYIPHSKNMKDGKNPIAFIFDELLKMGCSPIPVAGLDRDDLYKEEVKKVLSKNKSVGICLRIPIESFVESQFENNLNSMLAKLKIELKNAHLIVDLGAPNFVPLEGFVKAIRETISQYSKLREWLTFSIIGTSFPEIINKGVSILSRYEWLLYKELINVFAKKGLRFPAFGDYTIIYPGVAPDLDWRRIRSAAKVKYTINDGWYIVKGQSLREGPRTQCHDICRELVKSPHFFGQDFSYGDRFIKKCATDKTVKTRNHTLWIKAGTNHHLMKATRDIANFYASSKNL